MVNEERSRVNRRIPRTRKFAIVVLKKRILMNKQHGQVNHRNGQWSMMNGEWCTGVAFRMSNVVVKSVSAEACYSPFSIHYSRT
jgi:hypothetical protein